MNLNEFYKEKADNTQSVTRKLKELFCQNFRDDELTVNISYRDNQKSYQISDEAY